MKKRFIILNQDNTISASMSAGYGDDGNMIMLDGYEGPYEVPDDFETEQHLYRLSGNKLVKDKSLAEKQQREAAIYYALVKRKQLLDASDYIAMPDYPLDVARREAIIEYRQALRDITKQPGYPEKIEWPETP